MTQRLDGPTTGDYAQRLLEAADYDNRAAFATGRKTVTTAGTAEQMTSQAIPDGFGVVIKAISTNTGRVRVGNSKANAESATTAFTLGSNESITLKISNLNLVWLDVTVSGEGVEWIVET